MGYFVQKVFYNKISLVENTTASIDDELNNSISIYPNPTNGAVNISSNDKIISFGMFDLAGKKVSRSNDDNNRTAVLYPNPTHGILTLNFQYYKYAKVYDLNGKLKLSTYNNAINIGHIKVGLYVIKLFDNVDKLLSIQKVIKTN